MAIACGPAERRLQTYKGFVLKLCTHLHIASCGMMQQTGQYPDADLIRL